jgi:hypothetical protein
LEARHLKPAIERYIVFPISNLWATRRTKPGDLIWVDCSADGCKLAFFKEEQGALVKGQDEQVAEPALALVSARSTRASRALSRRASPDTQN